MENESYLIPANSKKSSLILGFFTTLDLIIFGIGVGISIIALMTIHTNSLKTMILIVTPGLISAFLVLPVPYYHNIMQLISNIFHYITSRRRYYWKGWCVTNEDER